MRKSILYSLTVLFIAALLLFGLKNSGPMQAFATNIMSRQGFLAMTPYGVAEAHDTETTLRKAPAIYWGQDSDGVITYADGTYQYAFNSSCDPVLMVVPLIADPAAGNAYTAQAYTVGNEVAYYRVHKTASSTVTDVTATVSVYWVAFGWR